MSDLVFKVEREPGFACLFLEAYHKDGRLLALGTATPCDAKWIYSWNSCVEGAQDRKQVLAIRAELRKRLKLAIA